MINVAAALDFRALGRTFPDASNSEPLVLLIMEGISRADVVTSTLGRHDVGTSRRWNVATLQHFHAFLSTAPICFQSLLFSLPFHLHSKKLPYSSIGLLKHIFKRKITLKA